MKRKFNGSSVVSGKRRRNSYSYGGAKHSHRVAGYGKKSTRGKLVRFAGGVARKMMGVKKYGRGRRKEEDVKETKNGMVHEPNADKKLIVLNKRKIDRVGGENTVYTSLFYSNKSTVNKKSLIVCAASDTLSQWTVDTGGGYGTTEAPIGWFSLNPSRKNTGSSFFGSVNVAGDKYLHTKTAYDIQFANATNATSWVTVYVAKCISSTDNDPLTTWNQGLAADAIGAANANISTGAPGAMNSADNWLFTNPQQSTAFRKVWKIELEKKISLGGGALEHLHLDVVTNFLGDNQRLLQSGKRYQPGSHIIFYTHFGQLTWFNNSIIANTPGNCESEIMCKVDRQDFFRSVPGTVNRMRMNIGAESVQTSNPGISTAFENVVDVATTLNELF